MGESLLILWILLELNAPAWTYIAWVYYCGKIFVNFAKQLLKDYTEGS